MIIIGIVIRAKHAKACDAKLKGLTNQMSFRPSDLDYRTASCYFKFKGIHIILGAFFILLEVSYDSIRKWTL